MPEREILEKLLRDKGIALAGQIIESQDEERVFYAFVRAKLSNDGRREPSVFALDQIANAALALDIRMSLIVVGGERDDLDGSLKTMLSGKFPDVVRNSFAAFVGNRADVWIEPKQDLTADQRTAIERSIVDFLDFLSLSLGSVTITRFANIPTPTAILRTLRTTAPCSAGTIMAALTQKEFVVPNEVWMNHVLDKLRKSGAVARKKNGHYMLTLKGLW